MALMKSRYLLLQRDRVGARVFYKPTTVRLGKWRSIAHAPFRNKIPNTPFTTTELATANIGWDLCWRTRAAAMRIRDDHLHAAYGGNIEIKEVVWDGTSQGKPAAACAGKSERDNAQSDGIGVRDTKVRTRKKGRDDIRDQPRQATDNPRRRRTGEASSGHRRSVITDHERETLITFLTRASHKQPINERRLHVTVAMLCKIVTRLTRNIGDEEQTGSRA